MFRIAFGLAASRQKIFIRIVGKPMRSEGRRLREKFEPIPQNVESFAAESQQRQLGTRDVRATDVAARRSLGSIASE